MQVSVVSRICGHCGEEKPEDTEDARFYLGKWMCSRRCAHNAGDKTGCYGWNCGCTSYAKKRRLLRDHRRNMRVMDDVITENGLEQELEERLIEETGNTNFWLGHDREMDGDSDQEDPEAAAKQRANDLLQESKGKEAFVTAAQDALACRAVATDLERARLQLEDLRAQASR